MIFWEAPLVELSEVCTAKVGKGSQLWYMSGMCNGTEEFMYLYLLFIASPSICLAFGNLQLAFCLYLIWQMVWSVCCKFHSWSLLYRKPNEDPWFWKLNVQRVKSLSHVLYVSSNCETTVLVVEVSNVWNRGDTNSVSAMVHPWLTQVLIQDYRCQTGVFVLRPFEPTQLMVKCYGEMSVVFHIIIAFTLISKLMHSR